MDVPETRYAVADDGVHLAYQVFGDGPIDQFWIHSFLGGLEVLWEYPPFVALQSKLASFSRVIRHDMRGTGLSDRATSLPDLETQVRDMKTVLDAAGSHSTVLVGVANGGHVAALFAVTHPRRTQSLVLFGTPARSRSADDYPWGCSEEQVTRELGQLASTWGPRPTRHRPWRRISPRTHSIADRSSGWPRCSGTGDARNPRSS